MPIQDPERIPAGFDGLPGGMDSGLEPSLVPSNQASYLENMTVRGGSPASRPGFRQIKFDTSTAARLAAYTALVEGRFQGADYFDDSQHRGSLVVAAGGKLFRLDITGNVAVATDVSPPDPGDDRLTPVYMEQVDDALVVQDTQAKPAIYQGAGSRRAAPDEVPVGSGPMAYGWGRLWVALGYTYVAGDIYGGPTGPLKFTENDYIAEGGEFRVPLKTGAITGMIFTATPDTALGQGELLVGTNRAIYSTVVPTDRDAWKDLTDPLQRTTILSAGTESHFSLALVNSDVHFRSADGLRSAILASRDFAQAWSNVPHSREVSRAIDRDHPRLLKHVSSVVFDNRELVTTLARPLTYGAYFDGLIALNLDTVSNMQTKSPPVYDGIWTGLRHYRLVVGRFSGVDRCFSLVRGTNGFVREVIVKTQGASTSIATVSFSGGGGSGAAATAWMQVAQVTSIGSSSGYAVGDICVVQGAGWTIVPTFVVTAVTAGAVTSLAILQPGEWGGGVLPATLTLQKSGGSSFTINYSLGVRRVEITARGSGYTSAPAVAFSFTGGSAATGYVTLDTRTELWEVTRDLPHDAPLDTTNNWTRRRIAWTLETPEYSFNSDTTDRSQYCELIAGQIWLKDLRGQVDLNVSYRPDHHPCWQTWATGSQTATDQDCGPSTTCQPTTYEPQYRPALGLPRPPEGCNSASDMPMAFGYRFAVRIKGTGAARVKMLKLFALRKVQALPGKCLETAPAEALTCPCPN